MIKIDFDSFCPFCDSLLRNNEQFKSPNTILMYCDNHDDTIFLHYSAKYLEVIEIILHKEYMVRFYFNTSRVRVLSFDTDLSTKISKLNSLEDILSVANTLLLFK